MPVNDLAEQFAPQRARNRASSGGDLLKGKTQADGNRRSGLRLEHADFRDGRGEREDAACRTVIG